MNFDQPYAQHFEKGRMKLKKLLMFEPFAINEIQVNSNMNNNKNKYKKNNVYEINGLYENTINTNYDNYNMGNDYNMRGNITNKTKKAYRPEKREKVKFIPVEVKKKSNVHSMEKSKMYINPKMNSNMNTTRSKKYNDFDDNNNYINEQINLYNQRRYNMPETLRKPNNVLNKYKKTKMSSSMDKQSINSGYKQRGKNRNQDEYFINEEEY